MKLQIYGLTPSGETAIAGWELLNWNIIKKRRRETGGGKKMWRDRRLRVDRLPEEIHHYKMIILICANLFLVLALFLR